MHFNFLFCLSPSFLHLRRCGAVRWGGVAGPEPECSALVFSDFSNFRFSDFSNGTSALQCDGSWS